MMTKPVNDNTGWDDYKKLVVGISSIPLTGGYGLYGDSLILPTGELVDSPYSHDNPIRNTYLSNDPADYNNVLSDYGYGNLERDKPMQYALLNTANEHDIPGKWLADSIALLTRGSFSPYQVSQTGRQGFANISPQEMHKFGVTPEYFNGDVTEQFQAVSRILKDLPKEARSPEYVFTALTRNKRLDDLIEKPRKALDMNNGVYTLNDAWNALGGHTGGAYDHANNDIRKRANSFVTESTNVLGDRWGKALQNVNTPIIPHEVQIL